MENLELKAFSSVAAIMSKNIYIVQNTPVWPVNVSFLLYIVSIFPSLLVIGIPHFKFGS